MNVPFTIPSNAELEKAFIAGGCRTVERGFKGLWVQGGYGSGV
jgi:hypothetical protein